MGVKPLLLVLLLAVAGYALTRNTSTDAPRAPATVADAPIAAPRIPSAPMTDAQRLLFLQALIDKDHDASDLASRCELALLYNNRATIAAREQRNVDADRDSALAVSLCDGERAYRTNRDRMLLSFAARADRTTVPGRSQACESLRGALNNDGLTGNERADALVFFAEILSTDEALEEAVSHYEAAIKLNPRGDWQNRLDALRKRLVVEGTFSDRRHAHFVARFEGYAQERLAWTTLDELEAAYYAVGSALNLYPAEPITVVIYTGDQYQRALSVPDWTSGVFDGKIRVAQGQLSAAQGQLRGLLRHEYTHALLATLPSPVPTWFNEGLAEHFENDDAQRATAFCARASASGTELSDDALAQPFMAMSGEQAQLAYASSHSLVEALVKRRSAYALTTLMLLMKAGSTFDAAFVQTFALTPQQHIAHWRDAL